MADSHTYTQTVPPHGSATATGADFDPPSRVGKVQIAGHFEREVRDQLKILAVRKSTSTQDLLRQALNALFEKNALPPIA
jgi:hypothetical protein